MRGIGLLSYIYTVFPPTKTYLRKALINACVNDDVQSVKFLLASGARGVKQAGKWTTNTEIIVALCESDRTFHETHNVQYVHTLYSRQVLYERSSYAIIAEKPLHNYLMRHHKYEHIASIVIDTTVIVMFLAFCLLGVYLSTMFVARVLWGVLALLFTLFYDKKPV